MASSGRRVAHVLGPSAGGIRRHVRYLAMHAPAGFQTFGVWGIPQGPYLFIPVLGPTTVRDGTGLIVRAYASPLSYVIFDVPTRNILYGIGFLDYRAQALDAEKLVDQASIDKYTFIRRAYLQRRAYLVRDGRPAPPDEED